MTDTPDSNAGTPLPPGMTRRELLALLGGAVSTSLATMPAAAASPENTARPANSARPLRVRQTSDELHYDSISAVSRLIASGSLSPVALAESMFARIRAIDGGLHSYVLLLEEQAIASARAAETEIKAGRYRGPLHGIPIGIKDLLFMRGHPTAGGTVVLRDFVPDYDATVVRKLEAAGAVVLGKNTLCEAAMSPYHPTLEIPVNPWNSDRWSGVSSSGSGVAVAAGLCFASIGTDTGGSIRFPSAANGCVGLKPTYGRVSRYGVLALAESLDHVGPMCRTVEDVAIMFDAIAGHDENDPTSRIEPVQPVAPQLDLGVAGLRIGYDRAYATDGVQPELVRAIDSVLENLASQGAVIVDVQMPDVGEVGNAWWDLATVEATAFHAATYPSRRDEYGAGFLDPLDYGTTVSGLQYWAAHKFRLEISGQVNALLAGVDCMICPSMSNVAGLKMADPYAPDTNESWAKVVANDIHTKPFNFAGVPTLSVPCGFDSDGMPFSVQIVGRQLGEATICRVGHAYQKATDWHTMHPQL